jgi:hypothetical protein
MNECGGSPISIFILICQHLQKAILWLKLPSEFADTKEAAGKGNVEVHPL